MAMSTGEEKQRLSDYMPVSSFKALLSHILAVIEDKNDNRMTITAILLLFDLILSVQTCVLSQKSDCVFFF